MTNIERKQKKNNFEILQLSSDINSQNYDLGNIHQNIRFHKWIEQQHFFNFAMYLINQLLWLRLDLNPTKER